ncbi:hypothetical protein Pam4_53 [Pseudanabaena phage Pam4]|nr:hypothetical protein Pam4_53 [Pseudanabaena phage Pam4]
MTSPDAHRDAAVLALDAAETYAADLRPESRTAAQTQALIALTHALLATTVTEPLEPVSVRGRSDGYGVLGLALLCATTIAAVWLLTR